MNTDLKETLVARIIKASIDAVHAEHDFRVARAEVKSQFDVYFRAFKRPEGQFLPYSEEWSGAVEFTASANERRAKARRVMNNAKARLERAVRAMERSL